MMSNEGAQEALAIEAAVRAGRAAWPEIRLSDTLFQRHLRERIEPRARGGVLQSLHWEDLYLACACANRIRSALDAFERKFVSQVPYIVARFRRDEAFADEVAQLTRDKLFIESPRQEPVIAEYSGRGPLFNWFSILVIRTAIDFQRRRSERIHESESAFGEIAARGPDPERAYFERLHGRALLSALKRSLMRVSSGQRTLLRLHFVEGTTLDELAQRYGVHRSTVVRRIVAARTRIMQECGSFLGEREIPRCVDWGAMLTVCNQLDFSAASFFEENESTGLG
jgi:RNA polymerase sigma-70 factor (ECF subfamily)